MVFFLFLDYVIHQSNLNIIFFSQYIKPFAIFNILIFVVTFTAQVALFDLGIGIIVLLLFIFLSKPLSLELAEAQQPTTTKLYEIEG